MSRPSIHSSHITFISKVSLGVLNLLLQLLGQTAIQDNYQNTRQMYPMSLYWAAVALVRHYWLVSTHSLVTGSLPLEFYTFYPSEPFFSMLLTEDACAKVEHQFDCVPVPHQLSLADMGTITE